MDPALPNETEAAIQKALAALEETDAFHKHDAIESIEAIIVSVEGWRTLLATSSDALAVLLSTENGRLMLDNSLGSVSACLRRVLRQIVDDRLRPK